MFLEDYMNGLASTLGTTSDIAAMLVAVICTIVVAAILVYYVEMDGLILFIILLFLLGLWTVLVWVPPWIALFIFFISLVYIIFGGALGARLGS